MPSTVEEVGPTSTKPVAAGGPLAPTPDGAATLPPTAIPFDDFGGAGPPILFAHANGFPPGTYRHVLGPLAARGRVVAIRQRPLWPGLSPVGFDDWAVLGDDIVRLIDDLGARDVVGIGHSLGGAATIYAAAARPDLFRALVLIEPVLILPDVLARLGFGDPAAEARMPLIRGALGRRETFPSRHAAFAHWRDKPVFARMSDAALSDYVNAALVDVARDSLGGEAHGSGELALVYPREWEARIYATPPTAVWDLLPRLDDVPALALRGADTDTISPEAWAEWQARQPGATFVEVPGAGHLVPMEAPGAVGGEIVGFLGQLAKNGYR